MELANAGVDTGVRMYRSLRPVMRAWYGRQLRASASIPHPRDDALVQATSPNADRVLLIGNGPVHGYGVDSHQLSLTGHLSRELHGETGRPCSVQQIGDETMNVASVLAWVGDHDVYQYDAVVLILGMNDAVRLTSLEDWEMRFQEILSVLRGRMKPAARIVVAGLQPVRSVSAYDTRLGGVAEFHAGRMNTITENLAFDNPKTTYFRLPRPLVEPDRPHGSSCGYQAWARQISEHVAPILDLVRAHDSLPRRAGMTPREPFAWSGAEQFISQAQDGGSAELRRLAALAQDTFEVDLAVVSLVEGDRLWYGMNTDLLPRSVPRALVYCNTVVTESAPLVVPDARRDPRFRDSPVIDLTGLTFYAGYPLRSSVGETIGTFCLLNSSPRPATIVSTDALRPIALQAEAELRRYEHASAG